MIASSIADVMIIGTLALGGILMTPLAPEIAAGIFLAAIVLAFVMDQVKIWLFAHFKMA
ncbi:hypothetical protein V4R08_15780 (plasmid) [Nitrobacter sp. NHB1]|uniref:hypothetical protein n=1 Tax=Nitrobacter sp. NHB1 TaxID=3119830 RepID=UPI003000DEAA